MIKLTMAALCAAGAMACAAPAGAVVMVASYAGSTNRFIDTSGVFGFAYDRGSGGDSLAWTATFTFDTSLDYQQVGATESARGLSASFTIGDNLGVQHTLDLGGVGTASRSTGAIPYTTVR